MILQIAFYVTRVGVRSEWVPSSVIMGIAIGLIPIRKQVPHLVGLDSDHQGSFDFLARDGGNALSTLLRGPTEAFVPGAVLIGLAALAFLFRWSGARPKAAILFTGLPAGIAIGLTGRPAFEAPKAEVRFA